MRYQNWRGEWRDLTPLPEEGCPGCAEMEGHTPRCVFAAPPKPRLYIEGDRLSGYNDLAVRSDSLGRAWFEDERPDPTEPERSLGLDPGDWDNTGRPVL